MKQRCIISHRTPQGGLPSACPAVQKSGGLKASRPTAAAFPFSHCGALRFFSMTGIPQLWRNGGSVLKEGV